MTRQAPRQTLQTLSAMPANRGVSKHQMNQVLTYLMRHHDEFDTILDIMTPHLEGMGEQHLAQLARGFLEAGDEAFEQFVSRIPLGPTFIRHMTRISGIEGQPQTYLKCRERMENSVSADELTEFDSINARRALLHSMQVPLKDEWLIAILNLPHGNTSKVKIREQYYDWVSAVVAQNHIKVSSEERTSHTIETLVHHGVQLQQPGQLCSSLLLAATYYDGSPSWRGIMNTLLAHGANWEGLGLEGMEKVWNNIKDHPHVKSTMLQKIAEDARTAPRQTVRKPSM